MTKKDKPTFTKKQLLHFKRYRDRRDLLAAVLTDDQPYTIEETDKLISDFMKGKVN